MKNRLNELLSNILQEDYPLNSRIHPLKTMDAFVKRDDELGFAGSKIRKYRSLIPRLKKYDEVFVIGGFNSNHVSQITQLLMENGLDFHLFLREGYKEGVNKTLIKLLAGDSKVSVIPRSRWPEAEKIAGERAKPKTFVLPEGGFVKEALPGVLSLPLDIIHEKQKFDHILVDAGTAMTAIGLILGYAFLREKTCIHVFLLAGNEKQFKEKLKALHNDFETLFQTSCPFPKNFQLHLPTNAKSFGSTNKTLFKEITFIARHEGILADPIYSGKLFYESKKLIPKLVGRKLIIHSGGAASLFGFEKSLIL